MTGIILITYGQIGDEMLQAASHIMGQTAKNIELISVDDKADTADSLAEQIEDIWRMEIEPYLEEYFFDQPERAESFRWGEIGQQVSP